jgi:dTDP-4-dehydrorhamnose reductase
MKVLVTGAAGQLGRDVVLACEASGDEVVALSRAELDVCDRSAVYSAIMSSRPHAVIHCAAWTAVDACESDERRAFAANALAVRWIAEACRRSGAQLVHVSTDYVFDGELGRPYHEWDTPNPRSVYGRSKLAGEHEALTAGIGAAVVRTSWVCGEYGNNMVKTVLRLAAERESLSFVADQRGHPTLCADLAPMLRRLALERSSGLHHITNQGAVSWFEFVQEIVALTGRPRSMVTPISTAELQPARPAPRPANSVLENRVLATSGWPPMRDFREPLAELVARLR